MSDIQRKLSLRISHVSVLMLALEGVWLQPLLYQVSLTSFPLMATSVGVGGVDMNLLHLWIGFRGNLNRS